MKTILSKLKKLTPGIYFLVAGIAVGYVGLLAFQKVPTVITSGTQVAFSQPCLEAKKDKEGKEVCVKKAPITIYALTKK